MVIAFSVEVLLALDSSRHSHLARGLIDYVGNTSLLRHLLFIFVENMRLVIFITLFEHQLLSLARWNLLGSVLVVLDEHGGVDMIIVCKIRSAET